MKEMITLTSVCIPSVDVVTRLIEDKTIIVPIAAEIGDAEDILYVLNETGQLIWQKLDNNKTVKMVVDELSDEFTAPPFAIENDVLQLTNELYRRGLLSIKE